MFGTAAFDFQQVMMSGILALEYCLWNTSLSGMHFAKFFLSTRRNSRFDYKKAAPGRRLDVSRS